MQDPIAMLGIQPRYPNNPMCAEQAFDPLSPLTKKSPSANPAGILGPGRTEHNALSGTFLGCCDFRIEVLQGLALLLVQQKPRAPPSPCHLGDDRSDLMQLSMK